MSVSNHKYEFFLLLLGLLFLFSCKSNCEIPTIEITADSIGWFKKEPAIISITECNKSQTIDSKIKFRGGMSSRYYKHSYAISLNQELSIAGLPSNSKWILNASYIDKSFMRHKLCFELFMIMGDYNLAPKSAYVRVYENDNFEGLYLLMQRLGPTTLLLNEQDSLSFVFKEPPIFRTEISQSEKDSMYSDSHRFSVSDKTFSVNTLKELEHLIINADDATFKAQVFKMLDIENIIDWHLLLLFTNNTDGQLKNFYLYRQGADMPIRIAIWDYDHSFGRDGDNELNMLERIIDERRVILFQRLLDLNPEGFNQKLSARWRSLRKAIFTEGQLYGMIDDYDKEIRKHIPENAQRWPVDADWYFDSNNYAQEVQVVKSYITKRLNQLDERFVQ